MKYLRMRDADRRLAVGCSMEYLIEIRVWVEVIVDKSGSINDKEKAMQIKKVVHQARVTKGRYWYKDMVGETVGVIMESGVWYVAKDWLMGKQVKKRSFISDDIELLIDGELKLIEQRCCGKCQKGTAA